MAELEQRLIADYVVVQTVARTFTGTHETTYREWLLMLRSYPIHTKAAAVRVVPK